MSDQENDVETAVVLYGARNWPEVFVMGYDSEGEFHLGSTTGSKAELLLMLERARIRVMED